MTLVVEAAGVTALAVACQRTFSGSLSKNRNPQLTLDQAREDLAAYSIIGQVAQRVKSVGLVAQVEEQLRPYLQGQFEHDGYQEYVKQAVVAAMNIRPGDDPYKLEFSAIEKEETNVEGKLFCIFISLVEGYQEQAEYGTASASEVAASMRDAIPKFKDIADIFEEFGIDSAYLRQEGLTAEDLMEEPFNLKGKLGIKRLLEHCRRYLPRTIPGNVKETKSEWAADTSQMVAARMRERGGRFFEVTASKFEELSIDGKFLERADLANDLGDLGESTDLEKRVLMEHLARYRTTMEEVPRRCYVGVMAATGTYKDNRAFYNREIPLHKLEDAIKLEMVKELESQPDPVLTDVSAGTGNS